MKKPTKNGAGGIWKCSGCGTWCADAEALGIHMRWCTGIIKRREERNGKTNPQ